MPSRASFPIPLPISFLTVNNPRQSPNGSSKLCVASCSKDWKVSNYGWRQQLKDRFRASFDSKAESRVDGGFGFARKINKTKGFGKARRRRRLKEGRRAEARFGGRLGSSKTTTMEERPW
ncbi:KIF1B-beta-like protein [Corchorus olitorius]|uniref:KIF1B-beta-like protein n=1 Tax=Corchorus olitorius TaxID=93759 RepID=A0A1R3HHV3_9ROSI|nr:KIF1B-beta-like protein [Corchorus olitorius]